MTYTTNCKLTARCICGASITIEATFTRKAQQVLEQWQNQHEPCRLAAAERKANANRLHSN